MSRETVAVLGGSGRHGCGIAQRLAGAGYSVIVGSRHPARAAEIVAQWPAGGSIPTMGYVDGVKAARIVILSVPFAALDELLAGVSPHLRPDTLLVDVTVPLIFSNKTVALAPVAEGSAAEYVRTRVPAHARVAGTFKTLPAYLLHSIDIPLDCDEFVCGDSSEARAAAAALVGAVDGLRPVDVGPLSRGRALEHLTLLAIGINRRHKIPGARFRVVGL